MNNIFKNRTNGPDDLILSDSYTTSSLNSTVKLRIRDDEEEKKYPPLTIYTMMKQTCEARPGHLAHVTFKDDDDTIEELTYGEYWNKAVRVAKSLIKLGVDQTTCVISQGINSSNYLVAALGTIFSGAVFTGIPAKNPPEYMEYPVKETNSKIIFVHDSHYVDKALQVKSAEFQYIIQMYDVLADAHKDLKNVILWNDFLDLGNDVTDSVFEACIRTIAPNKCALMCFTSGTTGIPKACMHSHDNFTYTARCLFRDNLSMKMFDERFLSFFSYSHVAGQIQDLVLAICTGATVYLGETSHEILFTKKLSIIKPTFFIGFPNIWLKIKKFFELDESFDGLSCLKNAFIGASVVSTELLKFFHVRNISLSQAYGSNEINIYKFAKFNIDPIDSVGSIYYNNDTKQGKKGELVTYGRNVFMGYLNGEEENKESFDEENWFHVNDLIKIDDRGSIFIVGRLTELIKTNSAVFIMPTFIENGIKEDLADFVSNCMVLGEGRDYLIALITFKCKASEDGEPLDELEDSVIVKLKEFGLDNITRPSQMSKLDEKHPFIVWFTENLITSNKKTSVVSTHLMDVAYIKKFKILPRDFSVKHRELNVLLKLCRNEVIKNFHDIIEECYSY